MLVCRGEMQEGMQERMRVCVGGIRGIQGDAGLRRSVAGLHVEGSAEFQGAQQDAFLCCWGSHLGEFVHIKHLSP